MSDSAVTLPQPVFIVSDGTGETVERVCRAALRQFRGHLVHLRAYSNVSTPDEVENIFRRAQRKRAMVVSTLVTPELRAASDQCARVHGVRHADLLGSLIADLEIYLGQAAVGVAGLLHRTDARYFRRIAAVEFTVKADDGKEPRMLHQADIILVGVSRTSKTPLSTFLAHKGFKVGNVPLVLDRPPSDELFQVDQRRVFALTIDPSTLQDIRRVRLKSMGMSTQTNYGDMDYILAELDYAHRLYRSHPEWPVIDVSGRAIEETASIILRTFTERGFAMTIGDTSQL